MPTNRMNEVFSYMNMTVPREFSSENSMSAIVDQCPDKGLNWEWDLLAGTFSGNDQLAAITKHIEKPSKGILSWVRQIHPEDREWVMESITRCTENLQPSSQVNYQLKNLNGDFIPMRDQFFVEYKNGFPVKIKGYLQPIAES